VLLVLVALLAACAAPAPTPTLLPTASASPTASPGPTASPSPTASPTAAPSPTPSPTTSPTASPTGTPAAVSAELAAALQAQLDEIRRVHAVPGISAAVIMPDGSRWAGVSGLSEVTPPVDVTLATPFVIGSVTKTFVTATIMALADEGALSIDDPLSKWLPDYPRASEITLRELLGHTSGVFNYFEHPMYNRLVFGNPSFDWTPQEILDTFSGAPYCDPGDCYHYSNTGFVLLGLVIEAQTGMSLGDVFRGRWFEPLGLANTYWQGDTPLPADAAYGHLLRTGDRLLELNDGSDYRPTLSSASVAFSAGEIAAPATDLATWCRALYGGGLVSDQALAEMEDYAANPYSLDSYGLGTRTRLFEDRRMFGHTGSLRGFYVAMWHFPVEDLTVVVELNLGRIDPNPLADQLAAIALRAAGYPAPTPSPSPAPTASPTFTASPAPSVTPTGSP
jgi:D-alanyl-D-alanine carboxypeptidase